MMVDVADIISKPYPAFNNSPADGFASQDEFALAKEGLHKIFDRELEALSDAQLHREFLTYSAILLSADSCPSELKADLSSFRGDLPKEISSFIQAGNELKVASDIKASITLNKFVLQQEYSKYTNAKKELASEEKISNLKASLATEESNKAMIDKRLISIETQVITSAKDELVSDLAQISSMEGRLQAANLLVSLRRSVWNSLRTTFSKFACYL